MCNSMTPSFMCLIFNDVACLLRIAWIANAYYGPASDGYVISPGFTRATLKLGQALMFSEGDYLLYTKNIPSRLYAMQPSLHMDPIVNSYNINV